MPMRTFDLLAIFCVLAVVPVAHAQNGATPNIVYIFADDMGWGTGQFNNPGSPIETPNLNQLAANGLNFRRHYSATVCSPSRGMLMTGFHVGNTSNDRNGNIGQGLRAEEVTVAEVLGEAGYSTAVFGKWGWGGSGGSGVLRPNPTINNAATLPHNKGFESFYGYLSHGRAHSYQVDSLWTTIEPVDDNNDGNDEVGEKYQPNQDNGLWLEKTGNNPANTLANYTHDLVGIKSEQYVRDNAGSTQPFYMQVNYTIPHFDLDAITSTDSLVNLDGEVIYDGGLAQYATNASMTDKEKKHAAMISRMDASIGSLIERLDDPNGDGDRSDSVLDNTLILFSSDNGPTPEDGLSASGLTNLELAGGLRGGKRDLYEGGIRTPLLVRWDAQIQESRRGSTDDTVTDLSDFMATVAELSDATTPVGIDGISLMPNLTGVGQRRAGKVILSENFEGSNTGNANADWTLIRGNQKLLKFRDGSFGLFDLAADPGETSPLDLAVAGNLALKQQLEEIALAEGAGQADNYFVRYAQWTGGAGNSSFVDQGNWSVGAPVSTSWSAVVNNTTGTAQTVKVNQSTAVLGLEVRGDDGGTIVEVSPGQALTARNEVRIQRGGRIEIAAAELSTSRWIDVADGGHIGGQGVVTGVVYNQGVIAPGRDANLPAVDTTPEPLGVLVPRDLDTGQVTLIEFDFTGVQDDAPLAQSSIQQANINIVEGFNFGPTTGPRNAANAGNEFNVRGFSTDDTLASALAGDHYLTFSVEADDGAGTSLEEIRFNLWRNGVNAAEHYAIFTSIDGFDESSVLAQLSIPENVFGVGTTQSLLASPLAAEPISGPIEVRLYGWGSNGSAGNTHFNHVSATGRVVAVPTWAFDFTGIQDSTPLLTATAESADEVALVSGLEIAAGLNFSNTNDSGDEYNVAGWSTSSTRTQAQAGDDYLSFTIQSMDGLAMALESVTFDLWRKAGDAPTHFAVMSSIGGFGESDNSAGEAASLEVGETNRLQAVGLFDSQMTTREPIEFRLYGWNAASVSGNVHIDGVSLRAVFQTVFDIDLDPTGTLAINGDLHHSAEGLIDLEIGGSDTTDPVASEYDRLVISGAAMLEGELRIALVDGYTPSRGMAFEILTASQVHGVFEEVEVVTPELDAALTLRMIYESGRVLAVVAPTLDGDFNADGLVNSADFAVWRDSLELSVQPFSGADGNGDGIVNQADFQLWRSNYGSAITSASLTRAVPEPSTTVLLLLFIARAALVAK